MLHSVNKCSKLINFLVCTCIPTFLLIHLKFLQTLILFLGIVISKKITSFVFCLLAAELPVLTETRPSSRAAKERSRETDRNFGLCRGSEGHSELELYKSASRTVWRICRRVDLADFGVLGRGRADADIPAIDSNLSATSSAPDVLKQHQINLDSLFYNKNVCSKKNEL